MGPLALAQILSEVMSIKNDCRAEEVRKVHFTVFVEERRVVQVERILHEEDENRACRADEADLVVLELLLGVRFRVDVVVVHIGHF